MRPWPSVHLRSKIDSTRETGSGLASRADYTDIDLLHHGHGEFRHKFRFTATTLESGSLIVSLREVLQNGSTKVLARVEYAARREEYDWSEDAPLPTSVRRRC